MDDQKLPLDLTVYGAIHQQEARKKSGLPPSLIWQGIYTVKFKKVPGPAPSPECKPACRMPPEFLMLTGSSSRRRRIIS
jgi:hypothetical protein